MSVHLGHPLRAFVGLLLVFALAPPAMAAADETVMVCDIYGNHVVAQPTGAYGIRTSNRCPGNAAPGSYSRKHPPGGMAIWTTVARRARSGEVVRWTVRPPSDLILASVDVPHMYARGIDNGSGWTAGLFWGGGSDGVHAFSGQSEWSSANTGGPQFRWPSGGTRSFGWRLACHSRRCRQPGHQWLSLELIELRVRETRGPRLTAPDGLWQATGWIRGLWALHFFGDSPTGLCATGSTIGGQSGPGSVSIRNSSIWHECAARPVDQPVDTSQYGQGVVPLILTAIDAAGESVSYVKILEVDNQRPTVLLSGPNDASSKEGTQYVSARATAGPSGVSGISCSVDGAPAHWYPSSTASVPVSGIGLHHVTCYSESNARDSHGVPGMSAPASWTLSIRSPSVSTVSFVRIANALRCAERRERVWVPGHWVTAYHHGHRVRVRVPAHGRRVRVLHCHPRVARRRVDRGGHWVMRRIVLLPHRVDVSRLRVRFGRGALVRGWLGTPEGTALAGMVVRILVAPDNGRDRYRQVALVRTDRDGVWETDLRPGPSRTVLAVYRGGALVEPSISKPAHIVVPTAVNLRISDRHVHWGSTIQIQGRVRGGYIPPAGEIVVLWVGWKTGTAEIGHLYTRPDGRFSSTYTFHQGAGHQTYRLWATSARETGYPYARGRSRPVAVTVSP